MDSLWNHFPLNIVRLAGRQVALPENMEVILYADPPGVSPLSSAVLR